MYVLVGYYIEASNLGGTSLIKKDLIGWGCDRAGLEIYRDREKLTLNERYFATDIEKVEEIGKKR